MSRTPEDILVEQRLKNGFNPKIVSDNTEVRLHNDEVIFEIEKQLKIGNDVPLWRAYNMLNKNSLTADQSKQLSKAYNITPTELKKGFSNIKNKERMMEAMGGSPNNEYEFIDLQLAKWNATMKFNEIFTIDTPFEFEGNSINKEQLNQLSNEDRVFVETCDPKTLTFVEIRAKLIKQNAFLELNYKDYQIDHALGNWLNIQKNNIIASIKKVIVFNPKIVDKAEVQWDIFIESITDKNVSETKMVMKHFIWQIKRKMFEKEVKYHMMPVMKGEQGIGKSTIIKSLCKPIEEFVANTDFRAIADDRDHDLWKNYVMVFDEMGNSTRTNIEEIKRKITLDVFKSRVMKSNGNTQIINKTTFIGSTNRDLSGLVIDNTGMRRFYQIECLDKFNFEVTNMIDFMLLWNSIDECSESPLILDANVFNKISEIQEGKRYITLVEGFLQDRKYISSLEQIDALKFFQEFQQYESAHDPKSTYNTTRFGRDLLDTFKRIKGLSVEKKRTSKGLCYQIFQEIE